MSGQKAYLDMEIELYDNGISLSSVTSEMDRGRIVCLSHDIERTIGGLIWKDAKEMTEVFKSERISVRVEFNINQPKSE